MQRPTDVAARSRRAQIVRSTEDGVMRIMDVPSESVRPPARRHELHRALGTDGTRTAKLPERRLDEVDGRKHAPRHAETPLSFAIPAEQVLRRRGRADADRAETQGRRDRDELAMCSD